MKDVGITFTVLKGEDKIKIGNRNRYRDKKKRLVFFGRFNTIKEADEYAEKQKKKGIILKMS